MPSWIQPAGYRQFNVATRLNFITRDYETSFQTGIAHPGFDSERAAVQFFSMLNVNPTGDYFGEPCWLFVRPKK